MKQAIYDLLEKAVCHDLFRQFVTIERGHCSMTCISRHYFYQCQNQQAFSEKAIIKDQMAKPILPGRICQITILCPWALRLMVLTVLKASSQSSRLGKKYRMPLGKNCQLFIYPKIFQWQYKEAMQFVLWVAQKIDLQAWRVFSIFKFMKLKSYDKNNIYIYT